MTNETSAAERYVDELRHRAFAAAQSLRMDQSGAPPQESGNRLRVVLANMLPAQFGVAAGTVMSSSRKLAPIRIDGAMIFDQTRNSPLLHAVGEDELFPIEIVLAAISRIPVVDPDAGGDVAAAIVPLRRMALRGKFYQSYNSIAKPNGKRIANLREHRSDVPPRTFIIAGSLGWTRPDEAIKGLKDLLQPIDDCRLDGLLVLDRDWFFCQPDNKNRIELTTEGGTIGFVQKLITDLLGAETGTVSLARYAPA